MIDGYKVVSVTPAGRRRYMELLARYLLRERGLIDRHEWWLNTNCPADIDYLQTLTKQFPDFFEIVTSGSPMPPVGSRVEKHGEWCSRISEWFPRTVDPDTIYIRLDDDIVYIAPDAVRCLLRFRIDNPAPLLVYPCIVNNSIISHLLQRTGAVPLHKGRCDYTTWKLGWNNGPLAELIHRCFLEALEKNELGKWQFDEWRLHYYERVSINCISWFGKDFAAFGGQVGRDEEPSLTTELPSRLGRPNVIFGRSLVVHFSYCTQNSYMEQTDLLEQYQKLQNRTFANEEPSAILAGTKM